MAKEIWIKVRSDEQERAEWNEEAARSGMSLSALLRHLMSEWIKRRGGK